MPEYIVFAMPPTDGGAGPSGIPGWGHGRAGSRRVG